MVVKPTRVDRTWHVFSKCDHIFIVLHTCSVTGLTLIPATMTSIRSIQTQMYVKRDGSVQGPLWPRAIKEIVEDKIMKVSQVIA